MSKKVLPLERNSENLSDEIEEKADTYYNEDLARNAVGRLFDDDESDDDPPPIKSAFVTGFDRAPARSADKNPTKKRERPARETAEKPVIPIIKEEIIDEDEEPIREEPQTDRYRRRETATTRMLSSADDNNEANRRDRGRRRNPSPKPAVRVNVPTERQHESNDPRRGEQELQGEEVDSFRRKYTSDLISSPRNPNRPVRGGKGDVRKTRMKPNNYEPDTLSPQQMIMAGAAIVALLIVSILTWQLVSFRNRYNEAQTELELAQSDLARANSNLENEIVNSRNTISALERERDEYKNQLEAGTNPNQSSGNMGGNDNAGTQTPATQFPTTHTVASGENLNTIARRYYGNTNVEAAVRHIASVNNISNINNIQADRVLQITAMGSSSSDD